MACSQFHDFQQTTSMADKQYFAQQSDPMCPIVGRHHCSDIYQHKKGLQQTKLLVIHFAYSAQGWKENYMSDLDHLQHDTSKKLIP